MPKKIVILGLGSNLNPLENLRQAILEIRKIDQIKILKCARIYESQALLKEGSPANWNQPFLNSGLLCEVTSLNPEELLIQLKKIEKKMGRISLEKWSPRVIDIDILFIENEVVNTDELKIRFA